MHGASAAELLASGQWRSVGGARAYLDEDELQNLAAKAAARTAAVSAGKI